LAALRSSLSASASSSAEASAALESESARLVARVSSLESDVSAARAALSSQSESFASERSSLESSLLSEREELSRVRSQLSSAAADLSMALSGREALSADLSAVRADLEGSRAELSSALDESKAHAEKNQKLSGMLKAKMKELEGAKAQLKSAEEDCGRLRSELASAKERESISDSKLASLVISLENANRRIQSAESDAADAREERELLRKRVLDLEGEVEVAQNALAAVEENAESAESRTSAAVELVVKQNEDTITALSVELTDCKRQLFCWSSLCRDLKADIINCSFDPTSQNSLKTINETSSDEFKCFEQNLIDLIRLHKAIKGELSGVLRERDEAKQNLEQTMVAFDKAKEINEAKLSAFSDKVKRLKSLLSKSHESLIEKDSEIKELKELGGNGTRMQIFSVAMRVVAPVSMSDDSYWCLLYSRGDGKESTAHHDAVVKWVPEPVTMKWIEQGSEIIPYADIPGMISDVLSSEMLTDSLNSSKEDVIWPPLIQNVYRNQIADIHSKYSVIIESLKSEIEKNNQVFQAYKSKAQLALKRMGQDDKSEWQKLRLEDEKRLEELRSTVDKLNSELSDSSSLLSEYRRQVDDLISERDEMMNKSMKLEAMLEAETSSVGVLSHQVSALKSALDEEKAVRNRLELEIQAKRSSPTEISLTAHRQRDVISDKKNGINVISPGSQVEVLSDGTISYSSEALETLLGVESYASPPHTETPRSSADGFASSSSTSHFKENSVVLQQVLKD
jgi:chromosome segregation ATPase